MSLNDKSAPRSSSEKRELYSRGLRRFTAAQQFSAHRFCEEHPKQRAFVESTARFVTVCCSRRAGKTSGCGGAALLTLLRKPGAVGLYLARTRLNAKRDFWGLAKRLNHEFGLGGRVSESDLCITLPNAARLYLGGVSSRDEIEKFRGPPLAIVIVDESQIATSYMGALIDEVLGPALMDYRGRLVLAGTPGPVPVGYFHDATQNPAWEHHEWTAFDNPWLERKSGRSVRELLTEEMTRRGVAESNPIIQREWFGRWALDPNSLVIAYDATQNHYDELPSLPYGEWEYVVGGDLGWDDADALCVLAWNTTAPECYLVHEDVMAKQGISALGNKLEDLVKRYEPLATVLDFGGLGKKIADELTQRWGLKVEAADKARKLEHIELLNDALRTGRLKARRESQFANDAMLLEWDKTNPEKPVISERFHSDIADAVLYAFRRAGQWLSAPAPEPKPKPGTQAWLQRRAHEAEGLVDAQEQKELEELEERRRLENEDWMAPGWL